MPGKDSVTSIYLSIRGNLARAVAGIVPPKEVEDIVQETYVRVCKIQDAAQLESPKSFLFTTARNLAIDHTKRAETRLSDPLEPELENCGPLSTGVDSTFQQVASHEEFSLFCEAVRSLPPKCRRVFVLKKVYGLTQREISKELNIKESTVEKHIALGIRSCTKYVSDQKSTDQHARQNDADLRCSGVQNLR
jgi:RNA polymerase sigma-70 factor (ECF subfamily)